MRLLCNFYRLKILHFCRIPKFILIKLRYVVPLTEHLSSDFFHPLINKCENNDRLCGLVVRVPGYRSKGFSSILGATRFSE
jgi:hypothetical protein